MSSHPYRHRLMFDNTSLQARNTRQLCVSIMFIPSSTLAAHFFFTSQLMLSNNIQPTVRHNGMTALLPCGNRTNRENFPL